MMATTPKPHDLAAIRDAHAACWSGTRRPGDYAEHVDGLVQLCHANGEPFAWMSEEVWANLGGRTQEKPMTIKTGDIVKFTHTELGELEGRVVQEHVKDRGLGVFSNGTVYRVASDAVVGHQAKEDIPAEVYVEMLKRLTKGEGVGGLRVSGGGVGMAPRVKPTKGQR